MLGLQGCGNSPRPDAAASYGSLLNAGGLGGPCGVEGEKSVCHVETGRSGSLVNCFVGERTCHDGAWGGCDAAAGGTMQSIDLSKALGASASDPGGVGILTVTSSAASNAAAACASNPCNPGCMGVDVDAGGLQPSGGFTATSILGTVIGFSSFPTAKKIAQSSPTCTVGAQPANNQVCSYDYCCAASTDTSTTGTCQQWISSASSACQAAIGADYTVGIGCEDGTGSVHIPVCNRGKANAPSSGKLFVAGYPGNLNAAGSAAVCTNLGTSPSEGCVIDLALVPLPAGGCVDIDVARVAAGSVAGMKCASASDFGNGNRASMVNPPSPTNLPAALVGPYGASTYTQLGESDKCNNQSFVYTQLGSCALYGVQPPPPAATTFTYKATCLPGYAVQWSQFSYSTSVPATSEVVFAATTAPLLADGGTGGFGTSVTLADVKSSGGDPAICSISGTPAGCPKDLSALLGHGSFNPVLVLSVTETATTALPTVNSWQVSFTCTPNE
jgi:hypothetical protein